jgi:6-pyruvoyltetrahydropterin/6-carboxytetrahydropterin synthase
MTAKITVTRRLEFDTGHRLLNHEGKCRHVHGHRYALEATFSAASLDKLGRVVDFGVIKEKLGAWLDVHWDHTLVLSEQDRDLGDNIAKQTGQTVYYLPTNPTAENMAAYLFENICPALFKGLGIKCEKLTLHETPNCKAEVA